MDNNEKNVQETLEEETLKVIQKTGQADFLELQQAAKIFLSKVGSFSGDNRFSNFQEVVLKDIYQNMRNITEYTRVMVTYQHEFEVVLNKFLGKNLYLTYVMPNGEIIYFDEINVGEMYLKARQNRGRGNISGSVVKKMTASGIQDQRLRQDLKTSADRKKRVYQEAVTRFKKNKAENYMNYDPSKNTFYWWQVDHKTLGGWTRPIVNLGPIAEGYAEAVILEDKEVDPNNMEHALKILWENHIRKDSEGAAVKADVVLNNNEFAIKSGTFSTAMIGQYLNLALALTKINVLSVQDLKENLAIFSRKLGKKGRKIIEYLNEKTTEEVKVTIERIL